MIVVKLGGSLYHNDKLTLWLEHIAKIAKEENVIIVPGGGPFADQVRQSQLRHHFNDEHAHHMALLAMQQFGLLLLGLSKQAKPFYFPAQVLEYSSLSVWLPSKEPKSRGVDQREHGLSQLWNRAGTSPQIAYLSG